MRALILLAAILIGLSAPADAGDDVAVAQSVIRSQVEAFSRDDAAAAYSYAAPAIHDLFPQADIFMFMVQHSYAPVYRHKSFEFGEARVSDGKIAQRAHIVDENGESWEALYTLEQTARRQPENHRLCPAQGRPGGIKRFRAKWAPVRVRKTRLKRVSCHASESHGRARINSAPTMMIFTPFHTNPFMNAAA